MFSKSFALVLLMLCPAGLLAESAIDRERRADEKRLQRYLLGARQNALAIRSGAAITALSTALRFAPASANESSLTSEGKSELTADDMSHVRVKRADGKGLTFRLGSGELDLSLPTALASHYDNYEQARARVLRICRAAVDQIRIGSVDLPTKRALRRATEDLRAALEQDCPRDKRIHSSQSYLQYASAKRSVDDFALEARRLSESTRSLNATLSPKTVWEFATCIHDNGLSVAPATSSDEQSYFKLYNLLLQKCRERGLAVSTLAVASAEKTKAEKPDSVAAQATLPPLLAREYRRLVWYEMLLRREYYWRWYLSSNPQYYYYPTYRYYSVPTYRTYTIPVTRTYTIFRSK